MDRAIGAGEAGRLAGPAAARPFRAGGVPAAGGPVRELDDSDLGAAGGSARHARRRRRRDAARHAERRLFHHRAGHHHRPRRQGRDPDHRIRQGPARTGKDPDRVRGRGRASSLPADPHDRFRVRVRRGPDGDRLGRQRQESAGARHRRDGRHDRRCRPGAAHGAGVLRGGAEAVHATREGRRRSRRADDRAGRDGRHALAARNSQSPRNSPKPMRLPALDGMRGAL